jgi:replicative DNA helicase
MSTTETLIIKNLFHNQEYNSKVINIIDPVYFSTEEDKKIVDILKKVYLKYNKLVPYLNLSVYFNEKDKSINQDTLNNIQKRIKEIESINYEESPIEFLLEETETFCKEKALYNAIIESIKLYDTKQQVGNIPEIIIKALQVSIDTNVGHDFINDYDKQLDFYHEDISRYETHLENLNKIIGGGFTRQTMTTFMAMAGFGKTRILVDLAANYYKKGFNVLYITFELSAKKIRQRFDANIMDININSFAKISKDVYKSKIEEIKKMSYGNLIIKEYPNYSIDCHGLESLLNEIKLKKGIDIDIFIVDYITLMKPARLMGQNASNMYICGKVLSEEFRSIVTKFNMIGFTACQTNRAGWNTLDMNMGNIAESAGIAHTTDTLFALYGNEKMLENHEMLWKKLKDRLYSMAGKIKIKIGFDDSRMKHFDIEQEINESSNEESEETHFNEFTF